MNSAPVSRKSKIAWVGVALCVLLGFTLRPLVVAVGSSELKVTTQLYRSGLADLGQKNVALTESQVCPWGHPWRYKEEPMEVDPKADPLTWRWGFYSVGPNGVDDKGFSDDAWPYRMPFTHPECRFLAWSMEGLLLLAMTLAWFLRHPWRNSPRHPSAGREALRALGIAVPPTLVVLGVVSWFTEWIGGHIEDVADAAADKVLLPLPVAVSLSVLLALFFVAFALRMRRPVPDETSGGQVEESA